MIIKRAAVVLGLFFLTAPLWTEEPSGSSGDIFRRPLGPETLAAFTAACERLAEHPFITGNFEQEKYLSRLNRSLKSRGNFIIAEELGMVWETVNPFFSTMVLGKDYLMQSRPGGQKTVLSAQGNETFLRLSDVISAVFSGNSKRLLENFDVYFTMEPGPAAGSGGAAAWELGLSPHDRAIGAFAEKITMKGDAAIRTIMIHEQNGDTIRYILSNHSYPAELTAHEKALFALP